MKTVMKVSSLIFSMILMFILTPVAFDISSGLLIDNNACAAQGGNNSGNSGNSGNGRNGVKIGLGDGSGYNGNAGTQTSVKTMEQRQVKIEEQAQTQSRLTVKTQLKANNKKTIQNEEMSENALEANTATKTQQQVKANDSVE